MEATKELFYDNKKDISIAFLSYLSSKDLKKLQFTDLYNLYLNNTYSEEREELEEKSLTENEFYSFLFHEKLNLLKLPIEELNQLLFEATEDIQEIDNEINYLKKEKDKLNKSKSQKLCRGLNYKQYELEYYINLNITAKERIQKFLVYEIYSYAYSRTDKFLNIGTLNLLSFPYHYSRRNIFKGKEIYKISNFTIYDNKFLEMEMKKYETTIKILNADENKVAIIGVNYINNYNKVAKLKEVINNNIIIQKRSVILHKIIEYYNNSDYIALMSIIPMQIEGIFHDYCLAIGISEKDIINKSLYYKLNILQNNNQIFNSYNYYAHHFQVIRNDIAHGYLVNDKNLKNKALLLFLDLIAVSEMCEKDSIPINNSLSLIEQSIKEDYKSLFEWVDFLTLVHPDNKELESKISHVKKMLNSDNFWNYINQNYSNYEYDIVINRLKALKRNGYSVSKCNKYLEIINRLKNNV